MAIYGIVHLAIGFVMICVFEIIRLLNRNKSTKLELSAEICLIIGVLCLFVAMITLIAVFSTYKEK